jgi:hypothetical protein
MAHFAPNHHAAKRSNAQPHYRELRACMTGCGNLYDSLLWCHDVFVECEIAREEIAIVERIVGPEIKRGSVC